MIKSYEYNEKNLQKLIKESRQRISNKYFFFRIICWGCEQKD